MARHVFQYRQWHPPLGFYIKDPYSLPPLCDQPNRYQMADRAGLVWLENSKLPTTVVNQGSAHRPSHVTDRLNQSHNIPPSPPLYTDYPNETFVAGHDIEVPVAHAEPLHVQRLYNPDGTLIHPSQSYNSQQPPPYR